MKYYVCGVFPDIIVVEVEGPGDGVLGGRETKMGEQRYGGSCW